MSFAYLVRNSQVHAFVPQSTTKVLVRHEYRGVVYSEKTLPTTEARELWRRLRRQGWSYLD